MFPEPTDQLEVVVDLTADLTVINPFDFFVEPYADAYPFTYAPALAKELIPFLETEPAGPRLAAWLDAFRPTIARGENTVDLLVRINQQLQHEIKYLVRMEPGVQTPQQTLERACGSCRDTGWLLVQILRQLGIAARFASGYLIQLVADVKPLDGPAGTERDFTDLHAWAEAYIPGAGWIGLDPTSGLLAGEGHLPLACTADPGNAAPVIGYTDVCEVEFEFAMSVTRVHEDPRVTRPYTDAQWAAIDRLGEEVDAALAAHDVRLTQGGEPTFVSIDDMDGPEWNYTALSPKKRELALGLLGRLRERFAPQGLVHDGQGKWYPGEPLPRWALGHLLADRRQAAVARPRADRRHGAPGHRRRAGGRRVRRRRSPRAWACRPGHVDHRVRGRAEAPCQRSRAAGERRSARRRPVAAGRARAPRAPAAGGARHAGGLRAADQARSRRGCRPSAGSPAPGRCGADGCTRWAAIRRSACACRWHRCRRCLPLDDDRDPPRRLVRAARHAAGPRRSGRRGAGRRARRGTARR